MVCNEERTDMKPTIGNIAGTGKPLEIDIQRLLVTRMLVQADPGGGKSWALRRILEQTAGRVQQIILDIEGDFLTLREKFDYVICAPSGADAVATPQTAAILARRLRETRVSAIIDLYELKMHDRKRFVRLFLEELIEAPKAMWHPALVLIDEAHIFAPEREEAESLSAVVDLTARGRKRGLCPVLATQRLSKLNKDAAAGLQNKLIGVTTLDLDVQRAAKELAMTPRDAVPILRALDPGEFYCFGPALSRTVAKVKVGTVQTTHPEAGAGAVTKPPEPSEKIKKLLAKLTDLPKEAEAEIRTVADFKAENTRLKRELTLAKQAAPKMPAAKITRIEVPVVGKKSANAIIKAAKDIRKAAAKIQSVYAGIDPVLHHTFDAAVAIEKSIERVMNSPKGETAIGASGMDAQTRPPTGVATAPITQRKAEPGNGAGLHGPQQRILDAIAWFESIGITEPETTAVAFLAGYTVGGGAFNNPRGSLRTAGMIEYRGTKLALTEHGRERARLPGYPPSQKELHDRVMKCLPGPEQKLLRVLIDIYPDDIGNTELAERAGYAVGGAFNNPRGRLRTLGLITYPLPGRARAADLLFIEK